LPVLELYGDRGRERPHREQLYLPNRKNIILHWIEDASHNLPVEEPEKVAKVITEFIGHEKLICK
jgi:pimeloyl-ACP methyl ester carboxylesterase